MSNLGQTDFAHTSKETISSTLVPPAIEMKRIKTQDLFQQSNEIEIDHAGRIYRLRITQFNKLILTA